MDENILELWELSFRVCSKPGLLNTYSEGKYLLDGVDLILIIVKRRDN